MRMRYIMTFMTRGTALKFGVRPFLDPSLDPGSGDNMVIKVLDPGQVWG